MSASKEPEPSSLQRMISFPHVPIPSRSPRATSPCRRAGTWMDFSALDSRLSG